MVPKLIKNKYRKIIKSKNSYLVDLHPFNKL